MSTTKPAPFESRTWIPESARLTELAKLALEANVSAADVRAYLESRYSAKPMSIELVGGAL